MTVVRVVGCMLLLLTGIAVSAQEPRRIVRGQDRPLATYLTPSDRHVIILLPSSPPFRLGPAPGETRPHFLSQGSDLVLAIRVESIRGIATRRMVTPPDAPEYRWWYVPAPDHDANWVVSMVTAKADDVLKAPDGIKPGGRFSFQEEYGTVIIHGVQVDFRNPYRKPLVAGRRYLFFGSVGRDQISRHEAYEEPESGALVRRTNLDEVETRRYDELEQLTFDAAVFRVRDEIGLDADQPLMPSSRRTP